MRPKVGRTERSQPKKRPAISAPPEVESVSGTPPTLKTSAPIRAPMAMPTPMKTTSVTSVARSGWPSALVAGGDVLGAPDKREDVAAVELGVGRMGMSVAVAPRRILRRKTPRAPGQLRQLGQRLAVGVLAGDVDVDAFGLARRAARGRRPPRAAGPIRLTSTSRRPAMATTSPAWITVSLVASMILPSRRMRSTKTRCIGDAALRRRARSCRRPCARSRTR